jgi:hypothetical protein
MENQLNTEAKATKPRARKLHLRDGVHNRLRLVALQRGESISTTAETILDRELPSLAIIPV